MLAPNLSLPGLGVMSLPPVSLTADAVLLSLDLSEPSVSEPVNGLCLSVLLEAPVRKS